MTNTLNDEHGLQVPGQLQTTSGIPSSSDQMRQMAKAKRSNGRRERGRERPEKRTAKIFAELRDPNRMRQTKSLPRSLCRSKAGVCGHTYKGKLNVPFTSHLIFCFLGEGEAVQQWLHNCPGLEKKGRVQNLSKYSDHRGF